MELALRRPAAVWVTQIVLILNAVVISLILDFEVEFTLSEGHRLFYPAVIGVATLILLSLISCLALAFRKPFGRYLALFAFWTTFLLLVANWRFTDQWLASVFFLALPFALLGFLSFALFNNQVTLFLDPVRRSFP